MLTRLSHLRKVFWKYCLPRGDEPKRSLKCLTPDQGGVIKPVFEDRLCDGFMVFIIKIFIELTIIESFVSGSNSSSKARIDHPEIDLLLYIYYIL